MPPPASSLLAPTQIGPYRIQRVLGSGAVAAVYLADQEGPGGFRKRVALKVVKQELSEDDTFIRMLMREAQIGGLLRHPNVIQTLSFEQYGGSYVLVLEYVEGETLDLLLAPPGLQRGSLPASLALDITIQVCRGLHHAHSMLDEEGQALVIVHRDLKPQNIIRTSHGLVKIMDFGIARATAAWAALTAQGVIRGTPAYMSPEQVLGRDLDGRSDLFSLGTILWEVLCGEVLFRAPSMLKVMERVVKAEVGEALSRADRLLPGVGKVLKRMLALNPDDRFADANEASEELKRLLLAQGQVGATQSRMATLDELSDAAEAKRVVVPAELRRAAKDAISATRNHAGTIGPGTSALSGGGGFGRQIQVGAGPAAGKGDAGAERAKSPARVGTDPGVERGTKGPTARGAASPARVGRAGSEDGIEDFTYHEEEEVEAMIFFEEVGESKGARGRETPPDVRAAPAKEKGKGSGGPEAGGRRAGSPAPPISPASLADTDALPVRKDRPRAPQASKAAAPGPSAPPVPPPWEAGLAPETRGSDGARSGGGFGATQTDGSQVGVAAARPGSNDSGPAPSTGEEVRAGTLLAPGLPAPAGGEDDDAESIVELPPLPGAPLGLPETSMGSSGGVAAVSAPRAEEWSVQEELELELELDLADATDAGDAGEGVAARPPAGDRIGAEPPRMGSQSVADVDEWAGTAEAPALPVAALGAEAVPGRHGAEAESGTDEAPPSDDVQVEHSTSAPLVGGAPEADAPMDPAVDTVRVAGELGVGRGVEDAGEGSTAEVGVVGTLSAPALEGSEEGPPPVPQAPATAGRLAAPLPAVSGTLAAPVPAAGTLVAPVPAMAAGAEEAHAPWVRSGTSHLEGPRSPAEPATDPGGRVEGRPTMQPAPGPGAEAPGRHTSEDSAPDLRPTAAVPPARSRRKRAGAEPALATASDLAIQAEGLVFEDAAASASESPAGLADADPGSGEAAAADPEESVLDMRYPGAQRRTRPRPEEDDLWSHGDEGEESPEIVADASGGLFMDDGEDELWSASEAEDESARLAPASAFHLPTIAEVLEGPRLSPEPQGPEEPSFLDDAWALAEEAWRRQEDDARALAEAAARRVQAEALARDLAARDAELRRTALAEVEAGEREAIDLESEAQAAHQQVARAARGWRRESIDIPLAEAEAATAEAASCRAEVVSAAQGALIALDGPTTRAEADRATAALSRLRAAVTRQVQALDRARREASAARAEAEGRERALDEARKVERDAQEAAARLSEVVRAATTKAESAGGADSGALARAAAHREEEARQRLGRLAPPATEWEPLTGAQLETALAQLRREAEAFAGLVRAGEEAAREATEAAGREEQELQQAQVRRAREARARLEAIRVSVDAAREHWFRPFDVAVEQGVHTLAAARALGSEAVDGPLRACAEAEHRARLASDLVRSHLEAMDELMDGDEAEHAWTRAEALHSDLDREAEHLATAAQALGGAVRAAEEARLVAEVTARREADRAAREAAARAALDLARSRWEASVAASQGAGLADGLRAPPTEAVPESGDPDAVIRAWHEIAQAYDQRQERLSAATTAALATQAEARRVRIEGARQRGTRALDRIRRDLQGLQDSVKALEAASESGGSGELSELLALLSGVRTTAAAAAARLAPLRKSNDPDAAEAIAEALLDAARSVAAGARQGADDARVVADALAARRQQRVRREEARAAFERDQGVVLAYVRGLMPVPTEPALEPLVGAWRAAAHELVGLSHRLDRPQTDEAESWLVAAALASDLARAAAALDGRIRMLAAQAESILREQRRMAEARVALERRWDAALARVEASRKLCVRATRQAEALAGSERDPTVAELIAVLRADLAELEALSSDGRTSRDLSDERGPDDLAVLVEAGELWARRAEAAAVRATELGPRLKQAVASARKRAEARDTAWHQLRERWADLAPRRRRALERAERAAEDAPSSVAVEGHQRCERLDAGLAVEPLPEAPPLDASEAWIEGWRHKVDHWSREVGVLETTADEACRAAEADGADRRRLLGEAEAVLSDAQRLLDLWDEQLAALPPGDPPASAAVLWAAVRADRRDADGDRVAIHEAVLRVGAVQSALLGASFLQEAEAARRALEEARSRAQVRLHQLRPMLEAAASSRAAAVRARRSCETLLSEALANFDASRQQLESSPSGSSAHGPARSAHEQALSESRAAADAVADLRSLVARAQQLEDRDSVEAIFGAAQAAAELCRAANGRGAQALAAAEAAHQEGERRAEALRAVEEDERRAADAAEEATDAALVAEEAAADDEESQVLAERAALAAGAAAREATRARRAARAARSAGDLATLELRGAEVRRAADEAEVQARRARNPSLPTGRPRVAPPPSEPAAPSPVTPPSRPAVQVPGSNHGAPPPSVAGVPAPQRSPAASPPTLAMPRTPIAPAASAPAATSSRVARSAEPMSLGPPTASLPAPPAPRHWEPPPRQPGAGPVPSDEGGPPLRPVPPPAARPAAAPADPEWDDLALLDLLEEESPEDQGPDLDAVLAGRQRRHQGRATEQAPPPAVVPPAPSPPGPRTLPGPDPPPARPTSPEDSGARSWNPAWSFDGVRTSPGPPPAPRRPPSSPQPAEPPPPAPQAVDPDDAEVWVLDED